MLGRIARIPAVMSLAVIHIACSATREFAAGDPYANCADLGDLSLLSYTQADAEQRMRARVLELGGDTLLFGVRGRTGRLGNSPDEIAERRTRLLTAAAVTDAGQPAIVITAEEAEEPDALENSRGQRGSAALGRDNG